MKTSKKGIDMIVLHETGGKIEKYLTAYKDPVGIWTIGVGNTFYEDGTKVKQGDKITLERAYQLFGNTLKSFEDGVNRLVTREINQNQFDALVSFAYNIGVGKQATAKSPASGLTGSTLLKKVNANPCDLSIADEFMRWNKAGGKVLNGLVRRRKEEAELYFS